MKPVSLYKKHKRLNIIDLKNNHDEQFGIFIMALKNLQESDDWARICGIHGDTFKPDDSGVLCPTNPTVVQVLSETGEPFYCKHSVYSFIGWHVPYIYQFELLLNKYNKSRNKNYITLPYLDLTNFSDDFKFLNDPEIIITYNYKKIIIKNPLASSYYYVDGVKTPTTRNGFLTPTTPKQKIQLTTVKKQLNNALYATSYERFSSNENLLTDYTPLETPHNSLHDIIGGNGGNMSDISISAFDPLFWLHHCNMDRHFYTWLYKTTDHFAESIYPDNISKNVYESTQAPFFNTDIYSSNFVNYKYGWMNKEIKYMLLKDTLNVANFPYTYDIITPAPKTNVLSFIQLINIPVPRESICISVYIYPKTRELNRDNDFAGFFYWFGIDRNKKHCHRCETTKTNLSIDIDDYIKQNKINIDNINEYNVLIEGEGQLIIGARGYIRYTQNELVEDGEVNLIIK